MPALLRRSGRPERILSRELCDFYAANGDLIVYPACTGRRSGQEADYALCPSAAWLEHLSHVDFYRLYCTKLPSAIEFAYACQKQKELPVYGWEAPAVSV